MNLASYVGGEWVEGGGDGAPLCDPVSGEEIARASTDGIDIGAALDYARTVGGPNLRALGFAERGQLLRAVAETLSANRDAYAEIALRNSGNTKIDAAIDIDGATGTLMFYASIAKRLGDAKTLRDPGLERMGKDEGFQALHLWLPLTGAAIHINAFNFPSWGLWEKFAVSLLSGVAAVTKPATATALLSYRMVKDVIDAGLLPPGALSILCGGARGGTKTESGIVWLVEPKYIQNPLYRGLVVRENAKDLEQWMDRAQRMYAPLGGKLTGKPGMFRFPSGAILIGGHLQNKNAYTQYMGQEYQKILFEELTLVPEERLYELVISSARSTIEGLPARVFSTANPGEVGHVWAKKRFVDVAENKTFTDDLGNTRIFIPSTMDDNPILMEKDPAYVRRIEAMTDEKKRRAWRYGDWSVFEGQFFDKWDSNVVEYVGLPHQVVSGPGHVVKDFTIPDTWMRYRGGDWGHADPCAVVWVGGGLLRESLPVPGVRTRPRPAFADGPEHTGVDGRRVCDSGYDVWTGRLGQAV